MSTPSQSLSPYTYSSTPSPSPSPSSPSLPTAQSLPHELFASPAVTSANQPTPDTIAFTSPPASMLSLPPSHLVVSTPAHHPKVKFAPKIDSALSHSSPPIPVPHVPPPPVQLPQSEPKKENILKESPVKELSLVSVEPNPITLSNPFVEQLPAEVQRDASEPEIKLRKLDERHFSLELQRNESEEEVESLLARRVDTHLILEDYTDLFSDFDPRPFSVRLMSDDFISECKKRVIPAEKLGGRERGRLGNLRNIFPCFKPKRDDESDEFSVEEEGRCTVFTLLMPKTKRVREYEKEITNRLERHFQTEYEKRLKVSKKARMSGLIWIVIGGLILVLTLVVTYFQGQSCGETTTLTWVLGVISTLSTPAGWFFEWEGFSRLFYHASEKGAPDLAFYKAMTKFKFKFVSFVESGQSAADLRIKELRKSGQSGSRSLLV